MPKPSLLSEYRDEVAKDKAQRDSVSVLHTGRHSTLSERLAAAAQELQNKADEPKVRTPRATLISQDGNRKVYAPVARPDGYGQSLKRAKHATPGNSTNLESALAVEAFPENDARTGGFYAQVTELLKVTVNPDPRMIGALRAECRELGIACTARGFIREAVLLEKTEIRLRDEQYVAGARKPADRSKRR